MEESVRTSRDKSDLIYDWNLAGSPHSYEQPVELDDESLRDGLQSPSVTQPPIEDKIRLLHLMVDLGIQAADIGLPGAGRRATEDVIALAKEIADQKLPIEPNCAARTVNSDIDPIIEASQQSGMNVEASLFIGSSPIREYVEGWSLDFMVECTEKSVRYAIDNGLSVMFVTEDTTRARPEVLRKLYTTAIECGARRICLSDTVGHADPNGVRMLVGFMKQVVADTGQDVKIDWHGHRDRAYDIGNAIAAAEAGAHRIHGTALGVGERCGNVPMEHLLINFKLLGVLDNDLSKLVEYCELVSKACGVPIPFSHPVLGADAYRTSTGVHAAAVIKAIKTNDTWLVNRVYSGVPADWTGRRQEIEIGPMSGASNVIFWLQSRGIEPTEALVAAIFDVAKEHNRLMTDEEIRGIIKTHVP
jgi:2-isopropylmalate synthase